MLQQQSAAREGEEMVSDANENLGNWCVLTDFIVAAIAWLLEQERRYLV